MCKAVNNSIKPRAKSGANFRFVAVEVLVIYLIPFHTIQSEESIYSSLNLSLITPEQIPAPTIKINGDKIPKK